MTEIDKEKQNQKLDNTVRFTIAIPLALSIKLEAQKQTTNESRSGWIRKAIEEKLSRAREEVSVHDELTLLREEIEKLKNKE